MSITIKTHSASGSSRRAFTLIEITVVILILGIVAAIAAPRYSDAYRTTQLEATALELAETIRQVRQYAINHGRTVSLSFDNLASTYDSVDANISVALPTGIVLLAEIDSQTSIDFDSSGTPRRNGNAISDAMITLTWKSDQYYVQIGPGTGRVWVLAELPVDTDGTSGGTT